jgi:hypothetical protein
MLPVSLSRHTYVAVTGYVLDLAERWREAGSCYDERDLGRSKIGGRDPEGN